MAAAPLRIAANAPPGFVAVARSVDLRLGDVHSMLRLPLPARDGFPAIEAAGNFAIVDTLLNIVSGVSTVIYRSHRRNSGQRFQRILREFYPWAEEPAHAGTFRADRGPQALYDIFRNPQAHALGIVTTEENGLLRMSGPRELVAVSRLVGPGEPGFTEEALIAIETASQRPNLQPTILGPPTLTHTALHCEALYWGVRRMIELISADQSRMRMAQWFLRTSNDLPTD